MNTAAVCKEAVFAFLMYTPFVACNSQEGSTTTTQLSCLDLLGLRLKVPKNCGFGLMG